MSRLFIQILGHLFRFLLGLILLERLWTLWRFGFRGRFERVILLVLLGTLGETPRRRRSLLGTLGKASLGKASGT